MSGCLSESGHGMPNKSHTFKYKDDLFKPQTDRCCHIRTEHALLEYAIDVLGVSYGIFNVWKTLTYSVSWI